MFTTKLLAVEKHVRDADEVKYLKTTNKISRLKKENK